MDFPDCPPGTEDYEDEGSSPEQQKKYSARSKFPPSLEDNVDKFLATKRIQLQNGSTVPMLAKEYKNGGTHFLCHPCGATCLSAATLQEHLNGNKHGKTITRLSIWPNDIQSQHPFYKQHMVKLLKESYNFVDVGNAIDETPKTKEPPPSDAAAADTTDELAGYNKPSQFALLLDSYKESPLIGLAYLIELRDDSIRIPLVYCGLCHKKGDLNTITNHVVGYWHRSKYLERHYSDAFGLLRASTNVRGLRLGVSQVLHNLALKIESEYGRASIMVVPKEEFDADNQKFYKLVFARNHPHQTEKKNYKDLVDVEYIKLISNAGADYLISSIRPAQKDPSPPVVAAPTKKKKENSQSPSRKNWEKEDLRESLNEIKARRGGEDRSMERRGRRSRSRSPGLHHRPSPVQFPEQRRGRRSRSPQTRPPHRTSRRSPKDRPLPFRERGPRSPARKRASPLTERSLRSPFRNRSRSPGRSRRSQGRNRSRSPGRTRRSPLGNKRRSPARNRSRSPLRKERSPDSRPPLYSSSFKSSFPTRFTIKNDLLSPERSPERLAPFGQHAQDMLISRQKMLAKLEAYQNKAEACDNLANKIYEYHSKNPEKHPQYEDEWKKYWNRKYKEVQSLNIDASKYDFKPEWTIFWHRVMRELHEKEVSDKKMEIARRLSLPVDLKELHALMDSYTQPQPRSPERRPSPPASSRSPFRNRSRHREEPMNVTSRPIDNNRAGSLSPWDDNDSIDSLVLNASPDRRSLSLHSISPDSKSDNFGTSISKYSGVSRLDNEDINVVSVLRLLTALENYLGSLGPKVVDLLAQALRMEKETANSSEKVLDDDGYMVLFETVKEKLKGQLLAGLIAPQAIQPTKAAVQHTATLIHLASKRQKQPANKSAPMTVEGIGAVEKAAIANQIAAALITQGKTDVTTDELESLINAVVGMAKAKNTNITTADFLAQLTQEQPGKLSSGVGSSSSKPAAQPDPSTKNALQMLQTAYTQKTAKESVVAAKVDPEPEDKTGMEGLSNSDLKTLLQNFKDLSPEEQHGLIAYLKKLEARDPQRVEKLRAFVNLDASESKNETMDDEPSSPFSQRECGNNPTGEETSTTNTSSTAKLQAASSTKPKDSDDDDDDYTFEDVLKSASQKVKNDQLIEEMKIVQKSISETTNKPAPSPLPKQPEPVPPPSSNSNAVSGQAQAIFTNLLESLKPDSSQAGAADLNNVANALNLVQSIAGQELLQALSMAVSNKPELTTATPSLSQLTPSQLLNAQNNSNQINNSQAGNFTQGNANQVPNNNYTPNTQYQANNYDPNVYNANTNSQYHGNDMFNNQSMGNDTFNNQPMGNDMFNNQPMGNDMFNNQPMGNDYNQMPQAGYVDNNMKYNQNMGYGNRNMGLANQSDNYSGGNNYQAWGGEGGGSGSGWSDNMNTLQQPDQYNMNALQQPDQYNMNTNMNRQNNRNNYNNFNNRGGKRGRGGGRGRGRN